MQMLQNIALNFFQNISKHAPEAFQAVVAGLSPYLNARVKVRLVIEIDGPGALDPIVTLEGKGSVNTTGIHFDGMPVVSVKMP